MDLLGDRYKVISQYEDAFRTDRTGLPIKTYKCYDELGDQHVIVKTIDLPENQQLKELAIGIWEQDIRFSRKAISMENRKYLLKLIDARLDKEREQLLTVFEFFEDTLNFVLSQKANVGLFRKEIKIRKQFWIKLIFSNFVLNFFSIRSINLFKRFAGSKT